MNPVLYEFEGQRLTAKSWSIFRKRGGKKMQCNLLTQILLFCGLISYIVAMGALTFLIVIDVIRDREW